MFLKIIKIFIFIFILTGYLSPQIKNEGKIYETDEITVEGYRINTDVMTSPTKIKVISSEEIKNKNGSRLSDIIGLSGNIYLKSYGGNSSLKTISLNGLSAEHTVILLDGIKMNSFQNSQVDLSQISRDNIDKIEIINNGLSSIYGSEAVSGVINVITHNIKSKGNTGINISGQYGSYDFKKYFAGLKQVINNITFSASLNYESSKDNYEYYFSNGEGRIKEKRENSDYAFYDFNFKTNYVINHKSSLKIYSNYVSNKRNIPGIVTGSPVSVSSQQDNNWTSSLIYENFITTSVSLLSSLNYQNNLTRFEAAYSGKSFYRNISLSSSSQISLKLLNDLIIGYDLNYGGLKSNEIENNPQRVQAGLFLLNNIKLLFDKSLVVYPSLRYDYYSDSGINNLSTGLGVNYNVLGRNIIYLKLNIGNNFRVPSFNDLYWKHGGNKDLSQEKSVNCNAGFILKYNLYFNNIVEVTYSYNKISDKIIWVPAVSGFWSPENVGENKVHNFNIELKTEKNYSETFKLYSNITFNYCRNLNLISGMNSEKQQIYVPELSFKINSGADFSGFSINLFYQYISKRFTDFDNDYFIPSVRLLDGNLGYEFKLMNMDVDLRFEVNNIFNEDYQMISGYPMPLRNYKIGFQLNY